MSPRAAWRLESLGFRQVYDYTAGKLDWMAAGLPTEGTGAARPRAGDLARKEVPTCGLDERLGEVRDRVRARGWKVAVVVTRNGWCWACCGPGSSTPTATAASKR